MSDIKDRILDLLVDICAAKKVRRNLDLDLMAEGYLNSMGVVELLSEIEEEFEMEIPLEVFEPDDFNTANKIIRFVEKNMEK